MVALKKYVGGALFSFPTNYGIFFFSCELNLKLTFSLLMFITLVNSLRFAEKNYELSI